MLKNTIPFVDLRGKTPVDLLRAYPDKASALIRASRRAFGWPSLIASYFFLGISDRKSHRWLRKAKNPYLHEIENIHDMLPGRGIYTLNLCYEWGCTSGAYLTGDNVEILRVLDWPFPALGEHVVLALQDGKAGDFYNVTWPGQTGVFQGMAPGRFAACINQAPMRRHGLGFAGDWFVNRLKTKRARGLPPAHLLRMVFEQARSYDEAKEMLCKIPLAMPVIFVLTGLKWGEGCIIERLENDAEIMELSAAQIVSASNQFHSSFARRGKGWRPRAVDSDGRYRQSTQVTLQEISQADFGWLRPPMLNPLTRLVMKADAASGRLMVQGYAGQVSATNLYITPMTGEQAA